MEREINVFPQGDTVTILQGEALAPKYPEKIKLSGDIFSVGAFLKARYRDSRTGSGLQQVDKDRAIVIANKDALSIDLLLDSENVFGTTVHAQLEFTQEFKQWSINEAKTFTREELIKLIKFNKRYFPDPEKHETLLKAYQRLEISTQGQLKQESDTRGNRALNFQKSVNSENIPSEFILVVPIFKGFSPATFRVEICLDATDSSVRFWFESTELVDIIADAKDSIFAEQLAYCEDFVIINK